MHTAFQLSSPAFTDGDTIPELYTCKGRNVSPPLRIQGVPAGTDNLALIMHDPDAPNGDYTHWLLWNINPDITDLGEQDVPNGAIPGTNSAGHTSFIGPCPPSGIHRYVFDLYALDAPLDIAAGADRKTVMDAIADHQIDRTTLTGVYSAS